MPYACAMKRFSFVLVLIVVLCSMAVHALPRRQRFVWDWRHAQELDYERTLAKSSALTQADKTELRLAVARLVPKHASTDLGKSRTNVLKELFESLRVLTVDLNKDGVPEVIVQPSEPGSWCGATGNCTFWIFQKTDGRFKLILDSGWGNGSVAVETFNILPGKTFGYSDLVLGTHDSASEKSLFVYRFDGRKYQPRECYDADWQVSDGKEISYAEEPTITRCVK